MILRLLSLATTIIVSCPGKKSFASALAFRPTPPPRFDVFSERLVGSWKTNNDDQIVEEVMRSCGRSILCVMIDRCLCIGGSLTIGGMFHFSFVWQVVQCKDCENQSQMITTTTNRST